MSRVGGVAAFDAGETRGPFGALRRNTDPGRTRGFQLEAGGATHPNVVPSLNSVDQLQRRVNFLNVEEDPALVGPVNLEITVVRRSEQMIYGSICFVAFGIQYETR